MEAALLSFLCLCAALGFAFEIKEHTNISASKPVNITAEQLTFDRLKSLTLFKGKVKAIHDKVTLTSDEIRAISDNREATAEGHVSVVDSSSAMTLTCGNLEYLDLMNTMTAHDHPLLTSLDESGKPLTIRGRQIELNSENKTVVINQNVNILHNDGHAEAQKATYLSREDKFILEEEPKVYTKNGEMSGQIGRAHV
jgi:lipopolysaccharide export system protein LptA